MQFLDSRVCNSAAAAQIFRKAEAVGSVTKSESPGSQGIPGLRHADEFFMAQRRVQKKTANYISTTAKKKLMKAPRPQVKH